MSIAAYTVATIRATLLAGVQIAAAPIVAEALPAEWTTAAIAGFDRPPASVDELVQRARASNMPRDWKQIGSDDHAELRSLTTAQILAADPDDRREGQHADRSQLRLSGISRLMSMSGGNCEQTYQAALQFPICSKDDRDNLLRYEVAKAHRSFVVRWKPRTASESTVPLPPAPPPPPTLDGALAQIRGKDAQTVTRIWLALAIQLSKADATKFIDEVELYSGIGRGSLKSTLTDARKALERERRAREALAQVRGRRIVYVGAQSIARTADEIEAAIVASTQPGDFNTFAGRLSHVVTSPLPFFHVVDDPDGMAPPVQHFEQINKAALTKLVERCVMLMNEPTESKPAVALRDVPERSIEYLLTTAEHAAPVVTGLITHPIVLRDGSILATDGRHAGTGLFATGASIVGARPYPEAEAAAALQRLRTDFLDGFEFATALDADVAIATLMTGVERRILDQAPGTSIQARMQSSGKTTLARRVHIVLTGHDLAVMTFSTDNEKEVEKQIHTTLMSSPPMLCFDNLPDGLTLRSATLGRVMTSSMLNQRVLGLSADALVSTQVLIVVTGNNSSFGRDEADRFLVCRLSPATTRPAQRRFRHPDVLARGLAIREQVLRDVVGIIAGYIVSGYRPDPNVVAGSRFPAWSSMVREPLMWAGGSDVARCFDTNVNESETVIADRALLWALQKAFGSDWFTVRDVLTSPKVGLAGAKDALDAALDAQPVKDARSAKSLGWLLRGKVGVPMELDEKVVVRLESGQDKDRNVAAFRLSLLS